MRSVTHLFPGYPLALPLKKLKVICAHNPLLVIVYLIHIIYSRTTSVIRTYVGTKRCSDDGNVRVTDHHRKM